MVYTAYGSQLQKAALGYLRLISLSVKFVVCQFKVKSSFVSEMNVAFVHLVTFTSDTVHFLFSISVASPACVAYLASKCTKLRKLFVTAIR